MLAAAIWMGMTVQELELLDLGYAPPVAPVYDPLLVAASATVRLEGAGASRRGCGEPVELARAQQRDELAAAGPPSARPRRRPS